MASTGMLWNRRRPAKLATAAIVLRGNGLRQEQWPAVPVLRARFSPAMAKLFVLRAEWVNTRLHQPQDSDLAQTASLATFQLG